MGTPDAISILVPLDGSELAAAAIPWADAWARAMDADVEIARVLASSDLIPGTEPNGFESFDYRTEERALRSLAVAAGAFQRTTRVSARLLHGAPAEAIVSRAHSSGANLIVMATHGRGGFTRTLMGSVTASVIRRAHMPVLAIRSDLVHPPGPPRRVLVPLDGSSAAEAVLPLLVPIVKSLHLGVVLYWVAPEHRDGHAGALARIEQTAEALAEDGIDTSVEVQSGRDPAPFIVARAQADDLSFVAMSTHAVTGIGRWTLGSVTDWTIRNAAIPVMAVRPLEALPASWGGAPNHPGSVLQHSA